MKIIKILLVEDNKGDVIIIKELMKATGLKFEITHCSRLSEALNELPHNDYDVILIDLGLPDSSGIDTFKKIKEHADLAPIVILTGLDDEEIALTTVKEGAQDYLVKNQLNTNTITRSIKYSIERKYFEVLQKKNIHRLSVLSETTSFIHECEEKRCILDKLFLSLRRLLDNSVILMSECKDGNRGRITNHFGFEKYAKIVENGYGTDILDESFSIDKISNSIMDVLHSGKLTEITSGFHDIFLLKTDLKTSELLDKSDDIRHKYRIGITWNKKYFGSINIFMSESINEEDKNVVEAIVGQASLNLYRKKIEEKLKLSEKKFRKIAENLPIPFACYEINSNKIVFINNKFTEILGYDISDIPDAKSWYIKALPNPEYRFQIIKLWTDAVADINNKIIETPPVIKLQVVCKNRSIKTIEITFTVDTDLVYTVFTDVTERDKALLEIESKTIELEQIIYIASHDLRAPLVNVNGYSNELKYSVERLVEKIKNVEILPTEKDEITSIIDNEIPESLMFIENSVTKMDSLLHGLLILSRSDRAEMTIELVDMNKLIVKVLNDFKIRTKNIEIIVTELPVCNGDSVLLNQLFSNLIDNSIKYLNFEREGKIVISGKKNGNNSEYCIEDNGIGIPKEYLEKIFEIFYRLNPNETAGEGLGLSIVQRILNRLDGKITVTSEPEKGSKFCVSLPN
jgi:signal transduction histidine kinase/DNA-binding NarL/FixJ family response regulator